MTRRAALTTIVASIAAGGAQVPSQARAAPLDVREMGAKGDDASDDTAAFVRFITAFNTTCGRAVIPAGAYRVAALPPITCSGGVIEGAGPLGATRLRSIAPTGDTLTLSGGEITLKDLSFAPAVFRSGGFEVHVADCFRCRLENVRIDYAYGAILIQPATLTEFRSIDLRYATGPYGIVYVGTQQTRSNALSLDMVDADNPYPAGSIQASKARAWSAATAFRRGDAVKANGYIWQAMRDGTSAAGGTGPANPVRTSADSMFSPKNDIADGGVTWRAVSDAALVWLTQDSFGDSISGSKVRLLGGDVAFRQMDAAAHNRSFPQWAYFDGFETDHPWNQGVLLEGGLGFHEVNSWHSSSLVAQNLLVAPHYRGEVTLTASRYVGAARQGILLDGPGPTDVTVLGNQVANNNTLDQGHAGIEVSPGVGRFQIEDNRVGSLAGLAGNRQRYGIAIASGSSDHYVITGNLLFGNVDGALFDGGTGPSKVVGGNAE